MPWNIIMYCGKEKLSGDTAAYSQILENLVVSFNDIA